MLEDIDKPIYNIIVIDTNTSLIYKFLGYILVNMNTLATLHIQLFTYYKNLQIT